MSEKERPCRVDPPNTADERDMLINEPTRYGHWDKWQLAGCLAMLVAAVAATYDAWADIANIATCGRDSNVLIALGAFAYLVWSYRDRVRRCRPVAALVGPAIAAGGWIISSIGYNNAIQSFWHGGALLVVIGCVAAVLGGQVILRFLPAVVSLFFAIPVPGMIRQKMVAPLLSGTAWATQAILAAFGSEVTRARDVLVVNGSPLDVWKASDGLWMALALAPASFAVAFGTPLRWYVRLLVLAACPVAVVLCNVLRLVLFVWVRGYGDADIIDAFTLLGGWLILAAAVTVLLVIASLLTRPAAGKLVRVTV